MTTCAAPYSINCCTSVTLRRPPAELHGDADGADDAPHDLSVHGVLVRERAVQIHDVQHPRARLLEPLRDLDGLAVVDLHLLAPPLRQAHALPVPQIDCRNDKHEW